MPHLRDAGPFTPRRPSAAGAVTRWFPLVPPTAEARVGAASPSSSPSHLTPPLEAPAAASGSPSGVPERLPFSLAGGAPILNATRSVDRIDARQPAA